MQAINILPRTVHSSGLGLWSGLFAYLTALSGLLPWLSGRPAEKGPSVWHMVRLWCVDSTHFSTSAVSMLLSGLLLVGLEAACLYTLAGFWWYNFMPTKQRANWPATLGVRMLPTPLEWCMEHLVSRGQFWRCLLHSPVQQPQFSNTHTHSWQVITSDILTVCECSGECLNASLFLNRKKAGRRP